MPTSDEQKKLDALITGNEASGATFGSTPDEQKSAISDIFRNVYGQDPGESELATLLPLATGRQADFIKQLPTLEQNFGSLAFQAQPKPPEPGVHRAQDVEQKALAARQGLPTQGTGQKSYSFFDAQRGVEVYAEPGQHFELFPGGGVKVVPGLIPRGDRTQPLAGAPASSLFTQPTQQTPGAAPGTTQAVPGFQQEQLAITPAAGKTIARTGQTIKNPTTGVDEYANPGEILIEYTDGTVERRAVANINQAGQTTPIGEFGRTADELGITRQTEIKGGAGSEVTRAPQTAAQALAAAQTPEEKDKVIQEEGLTSTANLEFIGREYTDQKTGERRVAQQGNAFYQEPGSDKILERPQALQSLARETTSPSVLAERQAAAKANVGNLLSARGLTGDLDALATAFESDPITSVKSLYSTLLQESGVPEMKAQFESVLKQQKELDTKYAEQVESINNNPWLSEGNRRRRIGQAQDKYDTKRAQLTAQLQLYQGSMDDAREDAQFVATQTINQFNADRQFDFQQLQLAYQREDAKLDAQLKLAGLELQQEQFAETQRQFNTSLGFDMAKFEEDTRRFGLNYALQQAQEARLSQGDPYEGVREVAGGLFDLKTGQWIVPPGTNNDAKPLSGTEGVLYNKAQTGLSAISRIEQAIRDGGSKALLKALLGAKTPLSQTGRQLSSDITSAIDVLGYFRTGAAITAEQRKDYQRIFPNYLDSPTTALEKLNRLRTEFQGYVSQVGNAGATANPDPLGLGFFKQPGVQPMNQVKGYSTSVEPLSPVSLQQGKAGLTPAEKDLFTKESGLNPLAKNPNSTAFGIWQGLKANREKYGKQLGINPDTIDFNEQLQMGRAYITATYGTAERALAFWNATKQKNPSLAPVDLRGKVNTWISKNYVGY